MAVTYRELTENFIATRSDKDFAKLFYRVKPGLFAYVNKIIQDPDIAEDITINTLTKMWTKIDQYDPQYQITTWLYKIAYNECLYQIRERNRRTSIDHMRDEYGVEVSATGAYAQVLEHMLDDASYKTEMDWYEEEGELNETYESALKAIRDLKPLYKDILVDRLIGNMKYEDIAKKHDLPLQTIKNRIRRGKSLIAAELGIELPM